jgi:hypothetical protein
VVEKRKQWRFMEDRLPAPAGPTHDLSYGCAIVLPLDQEVTFHRVLPRDDPRLFSWTLADDTFAKCLALVTLPDVRDALEVTRALPSGSLVDGFANNNECPGKTRIAPPASSNIAAKLSYPRAILSAFVADLGHPPIYGRSFPPGAYTNEIADQTLRAGCMLLCTVSVLKRGRLVSPLVERIEIDGRPVAPTSGLKSELFAISLFTATRQPAGLKSRIGSNDYTTPRLSAPILLSSRAPSSGASGLVSKKT